MGTRQYSRRLRIGDQLQRELAAIVQREIADPRVGNVTLSGAEVSRDLRNATVYVTPQLGHDAEVSVTALNKAAGFLRRRLAEQIRMKYVPRIRFTYDPTLDHANRMDALIASTGVAAGTSRAPDDD